MPSKSDSRWPWVNTWITSSLFKWLHLTPARLDIAVWTLILWIIWLTKADILSVIPMWDKLDFVVSIPPSIGLKASTKINTPYSFFSPFVLKFIGSFIFAIVSHISLQAYSFYEPQQPGNIGEQNKANIGVLLHLLDERSGIKRIFEGKKGTPALQQSYSDDILSEVSSSKTLKILSIAGYENIGKGELYSLLYGTLLRERALNIEVILLDPNNGERTINERISQLKFINPSYKSADMKDEINKTIDKLNELKTSRNNDESVKIYLYNQHPIFRLIICDKCLFMNTYESDLHGHESPVYKIQKILDSDEHKLSLYKSFLNYFEKIKQMSSEVKPAWSRFPPATTHDL